MSADQLGDAAFGPEAQGRAEVTSAPRGETFRERVWRLRRKHQDTVESKSEFENAKRIGLGRMQMVLASKAEELTSRIDASESTHDGQAVAEDFPEFKTTEKGVVSLDLIALTDHGLREQESVNRQTAAGPRAKVQAYEITGPIDAFAPEQMAGLERDAEQRYNDLAAEDEKFEEIMMTGGKKQKQRAQEVRRTVKRFNVDAERANENRLTDAESLPGFKRLDAQLARLGLKLVAKREGLVWKFTAVPIEAAPVAQANKTETESERELRELREQLAQEKAERERLAALEAAREEGRSEAREEARKEREALEARLKEQMERQEEAHRRDHEVILKALMVGFSGQRDGSLENAIAALFQRTAAGGNGNAQL